MCYGGCQCKRCMGPDEERVITTNHMTWTTNKPTQPGWYWWSGVMWGSTFKKVVEVAKYKGKLYIVGFGDLDDFKGNWSGPLPEPDEPTERDERETQL